jgi:Tol biopolymer transport system component
MNNEIVFTPGAYDPIFRVSAAGGTPEQVTMLDSSRNELSHRWPHFLPDGNHFLFVNQTGAVATDSDAVFTASLEQKSRNILFRGNSNIAFASGKLLFERQSTLMAQPFDPGTLQFTGDAVPIAEKVQYSSARSKGIFSVSDNGVLIYQSGEILAPKMAIFNRAGQRIALFDERGALRAAFSPDGKKIIFDRADPQTGQSDIWLFDIGRRLSSRFTFDDATDIVPRWSSRGDTIVFSSNRDGRFALYMKNANGTGDENMLASAAGDLYATDWSRDGSLLSVTSFGNSKTRVDLGTVNMSGERDFAPFLQTGFNEWLGKYSHDGRWTAYQSDETGKYEVYVRFTDGSGGKWQISNGGGNVPFWSADGGELVYTTLTRNLVVAHVKGAGSTMIVDSVRTLFDYESRGIVGQSILDISPDGQSFLALVSDAQGVLSPITLVVNWDKQLEKQ